MRVLGCFSAPKVKQDEAPAHRASTPVGTALLAELERLDVPIDPSATLPIEAGSPDERDLHGFLGWWNDRRYRVHGTFDREFASLMTQGVPKAAVLGGLILLLRRALPGTRVTDESGMRREWPHYLAQFGRESSDGVPLAERFLLLHIADLKIDAVDAAGRTPLRAAIEHANDESASALVDACAARGLVDREQMNSAMQHAALHGCRTTVDTLLRHGADVHGAESGWTSLHQAAFAGHDDVADTLIGQGARLSDTTSDHLTPLDMAVVQGHASTVDLLLDAYRHARDMDCTKALHVAARYGHLDMVRLLCTRGANTSSATTHGYTPLHHAAKGGHADVVNYLLQSGSATDTRAVDPSDGSVHTPLGDACAGQHHEVVRLLESNNALRHHPYLRV